MLFEKKNAAKRIKVLKFAKPILIRHMLLDYARVSTLDQKHALQLDALTRAGCERTFTDEGISGRDQAPCP